MFKQQQRQIGGAPGNPQPNLGQQQTRMMRPVMTNNPGLRHLLQQVKFELTC